MIVKARQDFKTVVAQAGRAARTGGRRWCIGFDYSRACAPEHKGRSGVVRESTAWKIARGYAQLQSMEPRAAFDALFVVAEGRRCLDYWPCLWRCAGPPVYSSKRSGWAERRRKGHTPALTSSKGYEYRRVNRLGGGCWRYRCA